MTREWWTRRSFERPARPTRTASRAARSSPAASSWTRWPSPTPAMPRRCPTRHRTRRCSRSPASPTWPACAGSWPARPPRTASAVSGSSCSSTRPVRPPGTCWSRAASGSRSASGRRRASSPARSTAMPDWPAMRSRACDHQPWSPGPVTVCGWRSRCATWWRSAPITPAAGSSCRCPDPTPRSWCRRACPTRADLRPLAPPSPRRLWPAPIAATRGRPLACQRVGPQSGWLSAALRRSQMVAEERDRDRLGLRGRRWRVQGNVAVGERMLGAWPGVGLHLGAGGLEGGGEPLVGLARVELVLLGHVEQDRAVDAGGLLLVQGGVVDGDRVVGPGGGLEQGMEPAHGEAKAADGPAAGAPAQVGGGGVQPDPYLGDLQGLHGLLEGLGLLRVGGGAAVVEVGGEGHQARRGQLVAGGADVRQQPVPVVQHQHPGAPRAGRFGQVEPLVVGHHPSLVGSGARASYRIAMTASEGAGTSSCWTSSTPRASTPRSRTPSRPTTCRTATTLAKTWTWPPTAWSRCSKTASATPTPTWRGNPRPRSPPSPTTTAADRISTRPAHG